MSRDGSTWVPTSLWALGLGALAWRVRWWARGGREGGREGGGRGEWGIGISGSQDQGWITQSMSGSTENNL